MQYIGVDLTSAYARKPRAIDVAILDDSLHSTLTSVQWPAPSVVEQRDAQALWSMLSAVAPGPAVWAVDGPQGLAAPQRNVRRCEVRLGTPGRTPWVLPPTQGGGPFQDYIRSSVDLFGALLGAQPAPLQLAGSNGCALTQATLFEVFPGAEWQAISGSQLPAKNKPAGRKARRDVLEALGIQGLPALPTADQNDALVGAYLAWCSRREPSRVDLIGDQPFLDASELREGFILHYLGAPVSLAVTPEAEPQTESAESGEVQQEEWNDDTLKLLLIDDTVAHGTEPTNAWLCPGSDYALETVAPHPTIAFTLTHSATFPSGRGWRASPTIPKILHAIGHSISPLSRDNWVLLRVRKV